MSVEQELDCDRRKQEAFRKRPKVRSTSESSALDHLLQSPAAADDVGGAESRRTGGPCRQTSKSAIYLGSVQGQEPERGLGDDAQRSPRVLTPGGHGTFEWWFHRKRRSSKKKTR